MCHTPKYFPRLCLNGGCERNMAITTSVRPKRRRNFCRGRAAVSRMRDQPRHKFPKYCTANAPQEIRPHQGQSSPDLGRRSITLHAICSASAASPSTRSASGCKVMQAFDVMKNIPNKPDQAPHVPFLLSRNPQQVDAPRLVAK